MNAPRFLLATLLLFLAAASGPASADGPKGTIENTIGQMSEPVIRDRLAKLGYSDVRISKTNTLRYSVEAVKDGKATQFYLHPQTGEAVEIGPAGQPVKTWHMPLEQIHEAPTQHPDPR